jgi:hypothetical protein
MTVTPELGGTNYLCTLRGKLSTATLNEIFVHSLCITSSATAPVVAAMVMASWATEWNAAGTSISTVFPSGGLTYNEATAAEILGQEVTGELGPAAHVPFSPELSGSTGGNSLPSQTALVVSLTGGTRPNGAPMKGRFYLPPPHAGTLTTDGTLATAHQAKVAAGVMRFINTLNSAGHKVSIWSRTYGTVNPVTSIRVGNKFDTVRSRRNKLPETYDLRAITP